MEHIQKAENFMIETTVNNKEIIKVIKTMKDSKLKKIKWKY